jgi:hypothetical protein
LLHLQVRVFGPHWLRITVYYLNIPVHARAD